MQEVDVHRTFRKVVGKFIEVDAERIESLEPVEASGIAYNINPVAVSGYGDKNEVPPLLDLVLCDGANPAGFVTEW